MLAGVVPGIPLHWIAYKRRWSGVTVEGCEAVLRVTDATLPDGIERAAAKRGAHVHRFVVCPECSSLRKALFDPDDRGFRCRRCAGVDHISRHQAANDPLVK